MIGHFSSGRFTSFFVLSSASMAKEQDILNVSLILNKGHSRTRSSAGSAVIEIIPTSGMESSTSSVPRYVHGNTWLHTGMWSMVRRFAIQRPVGQQGAIHVHNLHSALGGRTFSENIHQAETEIPHLPANGQHNHCDIYQQNGRHTPKHPIKLGVQTLIMVLSEGYHTVCRTPSRNS